MSRARQYILSGKRLAIVGATAAAFAGVIGADAFLNTTGSGTSAAVIGGLTAATISAPGTSTGSVTVTWTAQAAAVPSSQNGNIAYTVERKFGGGAFAAVGSGACSGSLPYGTTSCADPVSSSGTYTYRVVARFASWSATSTGVAVANDGTAPSSTFTFPAAASSYGNAGWNAGCTSAVCGTAQDDAGGSGVASVKVSILGPSGKYWNGTNFNTAATEQKLTATGTTSWSLPFAASNFATAGGGDGSYTVKSYATDYYGNDQSPGTALTFTVDSTAPTVSSINRADTNPTNAGPLHWTVTFSEPVSNVGTGNFALATSNLGGTAPSVSSATASGGAPSATWTVTVATSGTTGTNSGSIGLNLSSTGTINDVAANGLSATTPVVGQAYTFDTTGPSAPTSVTLVNGGGTGSAYINSANKASISIDVAVPAGSSSSDTITLTVSDAGSAHTLAPTAAATAGAGTVHFTGLNLSSFNDGTITMSATSADSLGNASGSTSSTASKDTVAPSAATGVSLTNGGGTGSAYINNANKASINYSVTLGSSSLTTDSVALTITDAGSAHTVTPATAAGSSGAGTVNFNANTLTTLNDGNVTATATVTDAAGNASTTTSVTKTKDVVAPSAATAVSLTNGGGTGSAYINNANKASVNYSVTLGAGSVTADSVSLSIADAGSAHTVTPSGQAGTSGAGTLTFNANNLNSFNDGSVTATATVTDAAGNASGTTSVSKTKDVVAPGVPTAVSLTNGGGTGSAYINNAGKASVNYSATLGSGSLTSDTIALSIADAGSAHTVTPGSVAGTSGAGSVNFNANNLTSLNDGNVTAGATATDAAGNTSGTTTATNTKDVVAPTNSLSLSAAGSAALTGATVYYRGNDGTAGNRTFKLQNTVADSGSGPASSQYTALGGTTTGWTFTGASTVSTPSGGPYLSSTAFTWSNPTSSSPTEVVTGADAAGNTTAVTLTFTNDITGPTNSLAAANQSGGGAYISGSTLYFKGGVAGSFTLVNTVADAGSGPISATFPLANNNGWTHSAETISTPSGGPYSSSTYSYTSTASAPAAGARTFTSTDAVTNVSASTVLTFTGDSTAPATTATLSPVANGSGWESADTTVNLSASDGGAGIASITYSATGAQTISSTTVNGTSAAPVINTEGTTTVSYAATDNVGNVEATKTVTVNLDKLSPSAPTMAAVPSLIGSGQVLSVSSATDNGPAGVGSVSYYYCSGTSCTPGTLAGTGSTGPSYSFTWSSLPSDGQYTIAAKSTDLAGNVSALSSTQTTTIDGTAPTVAGVTLVPVGVANGLAEAGEKATITYSEAIKASTFCSTWTTETPASLTDVTVTIANNGSTDGLTVSSPTCSFHLGTVIPGDYVSGTTTFTSSTIAWDTNAKTLTITLGTLGTNGRAAHGAVAPKYTPPASPNQLTDFAGNLLAGTTFTDGTVTAW